MKKLFLFLCLLFLLPTAALCRDKTYTIQSPDCSLTVTIGCGDRIVYSVRSDTNQILKPIPLGSFRLRCSPRRMLGAGGARWPECGATGSTRLYDAPVYKKRKVRGGSHAIGIVIRFPGGIFAWSFGPMIDAVEPYRFVGCVSPRGARRVGDRVPRSGFRSARSRRIRALCVRDTPAGTDGLAFGELFIRRRSRTPTPVRPALRNGTPPAWRSCRCAQLQSAGALNVLQYGRRSRILIRMFPATEAARTNLERRISRPLRGGRARRLTTACRAWCEGSTSRS